MRSISLRPSGILESIEAFTEKKCPKSEEMECQRKGYILSNVTLGKGSYAKVKLAHVTSMKLKQDKYLRNELEKAGSYKVAIKIISKKTAPAEYLNKFMPREIQALSRISGCPNVVKLFETFCSETRIYLVMEYADSGDLLEFINSKPHGLGIGEDKSRSFFKQLVQGMEYCHNQNVVHRDIKCENILIQGEDTIKISDFGFATRFPTSKNTLLETFCGSFAYAAPEILMAEKYDGKAADVWSLGVILFAMLNGRLPFSDGDIPSIIRQTTAKLRFSSKVQLSSESRDLLRKILTANRLHRIKISEILKHPWLNIDKMEHGLEPTLARGIPDGKSDKSVVDVVEEKCIERRRFEPTKPKDAKDILKENWIKKGNRSSAIVQLFPDQFSSQLRTTKPQINCVSESTPTSDTQRRNVSNIIWSKHPISATSTHNPYRRSKTVEKMEGKVEMSKQTGSHTHKHQKEMNAFANSKREGSSHSDRKSSILYYKLMEAKIPWKNLKTHAQDKGCYPGRKVSGKVNEDVYLPVVGNDQIRGHLSGNQPACTTSCGTKERESVSQEQRKGEQNEKSKSRRFMNINMNLKDSWRTKFSKSLGTKKKTMTKYYNLNGKEITTKINYPSHDCDFISLRGSHLKSNK